MNVTRTDTGGAPGALSVMLPVCGPTARDPRAGLIVIVPLLVPEAGERVSHGALLLAVQVSVPPPVLLIVSVWAAGLLVPCCAVNDKLGVLTPMAGGTGAAVTLNVTRTDTGGAPGALSVMLPVCGPTPREPRTGLIVIVPLLVPEAGERVSHGALLLAVQVSVPPPVLLIVSVWAAGLLVPCCAVNDKLGVLTPMAGGTGAAVTLNVTRTDTGGAPGALSVMLPVCGPTPREPRTGLIVIVPLPVPEGGERTSHAVVEVAFQFNIPPPLLVTERI